MDHLKKSLLATAQWFRNSGVMRPDDGSWGVGERVLLTEGNPTAEKVYMSFPAWTEHEKHSIVEQRRADCCFETVFMFQQMAVVLDDPQYKTIAYNMLDFLYRRSGMLVRRPEYHSCWNWSHISCGGRWFDDNAWVCILQLMIAKANPDWDREFKMTEWGIKLANFMADAFLYQFRNPDTPICLGNLKLPHWGSLPVMALARAYTVEKNEKYREAADVYHRYLQGAHDKLTTSEFGYAVLGATMAHKVYGDALSLEIANLFGQKILDRMDPVTGNIPAEHYEAPSGTNLADTIYTLNWAVLALQCLADLTGEEKYRNALDKLMALLLRIQDSSPENYLCGCWRGMFDLDSDSWGGGDHYEGGAGSIYTGWTNAPIAWAVINTIGNKSLLEY